MRPPSVDSLARELADVDLPHPLLVDAARAAIAAGDPGRARAEAEAVHRTLLQPVINATGVLLHTNLGRAPLAHHQAAGASNLELDLASGQRGSRSAHAGALLARAAGAEAALVVNNGAAAVLLVLAALARGRDVVVSRGELVEIGGGFRVPEVLATSGARLAEVGTTNRTRPADYRTALDDPATDAAVVLKVHQSIYRITGFTEAVDVATVAELAGAATTGSAGPGGADRPAASGGTGGGPPVVVDLGSGLLDAACPWLPDGPPRWLAGEPAVRQTFAAGASVVVFSGDKLLGGPQAGIVAGRADLVARCAAHPLARALRPGSLVLGALQDVALAYLDRTAGALPFWRLATTPVAALRARSEAVVGDASGASVVDTAAVTGGGTLPGVDIPSAGVALPGDRTAALRACSPPVVARVQESRTVLDLRTVEPGDDAVLARAVAEVMGPRTGAP